MNVEQFDRVAEVIYATAENELPVLGRSSNTGMVYELASHEVTVVTDEMVVMGCKYPVGTPIVLFNLD